MLRHLVIIIWWHNIVGKNLWKRRRRRVMNGSNLDQIVVVSSHGIWRSSCSVTMGTRSNMMRPRLGGWW